MNTIILKEYYSPIRYPHWKKIEPKEIKNILEGKTFQEYRMKFLLKKEDRTILVLYFGMKFVSKKTNKSNS
jgi:hypothetical protein